MTSAEEQYLDAIKAYREAQKRADDRWHEMMRWYELWVSEDDD